MLRSSLEDKENDRSPQVRHPFAHGSIVRIEFRNFLTYDTVTVKPGPHLNVVIGPNGTGKSSIICGICLAVGGSPRVLGRSDMIGDFIKHGKHEGSVKLYLWDHRRRRERCFSVHIKLPNSATYYIDNLHTKVTELRERVKEYNIQVENPCTFLAQDKVKSFAEQGANLLLLNTQKAGPSELSERHEELKEFSEEGADFQDQLDRRNKRLEQMELELKTKKARVDNYLEWSKRSKVITLLKWKKALQEYERELDGQREALAELDELGERIKEMQEREKAQRSTRDAIGTTCAAIERELTELKDRHRTNVRDIEELKKQMDQCMGTDLQDASVELEQIRKQFNDWDAEKARIAETYRKFKAALQRATMEFKPNPELPKIREQIEKEQNRLNKVVANIEQRQESQTRMKSQLDRNSREQRDLMESKLSRVVALTGNRGIMEAWEYYTRNKHLFQGPVYVPYLHISIPSSDSLLYLNNLIATRDMGIFVFSCKADEELLLRGGNPFKIHSTIIDENSIQQVQQLKSQQQLPDTLKSLGFTAFASNLFEAPDPVYAYLCFTFNLDRVLIGGITVEEHYERIANQLPDRVYNLFLTTKYRIEISFSRFDAQKRYVKRSLMSQNMRLNQDHAKPIIMNIEGKMEDLRTMQEKLNDDIKQFHADNHAMKQRAETYKRLQHEQQEKEGKVDDLRKQIGRMERDMELMAQGRPDLAQAEAAYEERKRRGATEAIDKFERMIVLMEHQRTLVKDIVLANDELELLKRRKRELDRDDGGADEQLTRLRSQYRELLKKRENAKLNVEDAKKAFKDLARFSPAESEQSPEDAEQSNKMKEDFVHHEIPDNADEWDQMMKAEMKKASRGRHEGTQKDCQEYEKLLEEQDKLGAEVRRLTERNNRWREGMDRRLEAWLTPLRELIGQISASFSEFFAQLGCVGEVRLAEPEENKYAVAEYGVKILVKFRNGHSLRELSPQTQSGGERSVATMLYLLALQNLCPVPFRCMDEINQGMDPDNERAVFNMMVRLLSTGEHISKTQYFLLTPKLLNGLEFNERVTVHIVHNGPDLVNAQNWDPERYLRRLAEISVAEGRGT